MTATIDIQGDAASVSPLARRLAETRRLSLVLAEPLSAEDQVVQPMDDASPTKWHLAHTTWFFETFVLKPHLAGFRTLDERFAYCFNSYYEAAGPRQPRPKRGLLTRPSNDEVLQYRRHIDDALEALFKSGVPQRHSPVADLIELGINHEQQHQELILTDILSLFASQPLRPAYRPAQTAAKAASVSGSGPMRAPRWLDFPGGIRRIGHTGSSFFYDNECPRHEALLRDYRLADRLVTNGEWLEFMADGGYATPAHWLSDGWGAVNSRGWTAPGYWEGEKGELAADDAERACPGRSRRARLPHQLLRGRRVRALGRQAPADGVRVGGGRRGATRARQHARLGRAAPVAGTGDRCRRQAGPDVRRRVGVDAERVLGLSGLSRRPPARSASTTASSCAASMVLRGGFLRDAAKATRAQPIATSSIPISAGSSPASDWQTTHDAARADDPQATDPRRLASTSSPRP